MDSQATSLDLAQAATRSAANASGPVLRGAIRARQLDVLQMQLTHPGYFNQRRVDTLAEVGVGHTYWLCSHQISLSGLLAEVDEKDLRRQRQTRTLTLPPSPEAAGDQTTAGVVSEHGAGMVDVTGVTPDSYVLSVGIFRKERLPDLSVVDERGECVPVLSRREQAEWLAAVFTQSVRQIAELKNDTASAITERFQRVIGCDDEAAQTELESLKAALNELFKTELQPEGGDTEALHLADQVEDILRPLCAYTHVLVRVRPNTTGAVQLRVMFTRGIDLPNLRTWLDGDAPGESRGARFQALWAHLLQRLALTSTPIPLKLDGANHSQAVLVQRHRPFAFSAGRSTKSSRGHPFGDRCVDQGMGNLTVVAGQFGKLGSSRCHIDHLAVRQRSGALNLHADPSPIIDLLGGRSMFDRSDRCRRLKHICTHSGRCGRGLGHRTDPPGCRSFCRFGVADCYTA